MSDFANFLMTKERMPVEPGSTFEWFEMPPSHFETWMKETTPEYRQGLVAFCEEIAEQIKRGIAVPDFAAYAIKHYVFGDEPYTYGNCLPGWTGEKRFDWATYDAHKAAGTLYDDDGYRYDSPLYMMGESYQEEDERTG